MPAMTDDRWSELIGELYEAAVTPGDGAAIGRILGEVGGGRTGVVCFFGPDGFEYFNHDVPEESFPLYESHYGALDPFCRHAKAHAHGGYFQPTIGERIVPLAEVRRTEFHSGFMRWLDMEQVIGGCLPVGDGAIGTFSTHRSIRDEAFEPADEARLGRFLPHLQRALQVRHRLGAAESAAGFAALDNLAFGIAICDRAGRVVFANALAEAAARSGGGPVLGRADAPIDAARPDDGRALRALVHDACSGGCGGSLVLRGSSGGASPVLVAPLPRRYGGARRLAMVALRQTAGRPGPSPRLLASLFGLTLAEAELVAAIAVGLSLKDIRRDRGTSENTVRTQLGNVFRKTGARTQADLVRLVAALPPLR